MSLAIKKIKAWCAYVHTAKGAYEYRWYGACAGVFLFLLVFIWGGILLYYDYFA